MKKQRQSWEVCADATSEMHSLLDELEGYSGVYEETMELRRQLGRIERACESAGASADVEREASSIQPEDDPRTTARQIIATLPLDRIFQDQALSDVFLSELLIALARESVGQSRRERQRRGIEEAKAQGVRFGAPARPLPENFEQARLAWRGGRLSSAEAAKLCGMAKTTFYNAVRRVEHAASV